MASLGDQDKPKINEARLGRDVDNQVSMAEGFSESRLPEAAMAVASGGSRYEFSMVGYPRRGSVGAIIDVIPKGKPCSSPRKML